MLNRGYFNTPMGRLLRKANFLVSCAHAGQYPEDAGWEVAFVGRSNVGKSSAINALAQRKKLAHHSKTPGRTQLINFFTLDVQRRLVDLPGYGYAKVSAREQANWAQNLENYFNIRQSLQGILWLMDIRHPMQPKDQVTLEWILDAQLPVQLLLTKSDKLSKNQQNQALSRVERALAPLIDPSLINTCIFSAQSYQGIDVVLDRLTAWFGLNP